MSATHEIRAAIKKLTSLKDDTVTISHGWLVQNVDACTCAGGTIESSYMHEPGCGTEPLTNDPLTITLHATIDAQLAILKVGAAAYAHYSEDSGRDLDHDKAAMQLACAINGGN